MGSGSSLPPYYTPKGYIMPEKYGVYFLPFTINGPKSTTMHLNEIGSTKTEFCKGHIQLRQPPISWKIFCFASSCNMGVAIPVTAILQGC